VQQLLRGGLSSPLSVGDYVRICSRNLSASAVGKYLNQLLLLALNVYKKKKKKKKNGFLVDLKFSMFCEQEVCGRTRFFVKALHSGS
jgi:hypothetical protein